MEAGKTLRSKHSLALAKFQSRLQRDASGTPEGSAAADWRQGRLSQCFPVTLPLVVRAQCTHKLVRG